VSDKGIEPFEAVSALGEPTRRAVYEHVVAAGTWVSRDDAADSLGLERGTVAHHLDRLAKDGLLETDFQRVSGRQGPGAGRPAKLYRRSRQEFAVALPPRDYELAGQLLAEAVGRARADGGDVARALDDVAGAEGRRIAEDVTTRVRGKRARAARRLALLETLERHGFEPHTAHDGTVVLRNCPFHRLSQQHRDVICGMNLSLLKSAVDTVGETGLEAVLEPEEGQCCVKLRATA
jgi:predicted ArsR family transcriptional regulator